ncbi:nuclear transport factor 2 family protein [Streptomyces sp. MBT65]|uniref:nuclear transport factor 2 family protein n=1 Tax=Streptomyces sp. MBT65 TaxID=1488395 RepID=UPI00190E1F57|nr:nuclear transport factor 2 family protein [Streptomyces sp. MBT65]MBK3579698.1 nuclear transport factor 2 family protein [Streptomyces sp. MBT65]
MSDKAPDPTDFSVVNTLLAAIEQGDMDEVRRCFAPGALTWHNFDEIEQDVDAMAAMLGHLCTLSTSRNYEDRRITTVRSQAFLQYTLTAVLHSEGRFRMPAMMRLEIDSDGLVARIEEYFDSRVLDSLAEVS